VEAAIWHDEFAAEVRAQLASVDLGLVWVNPIDEGPNRRVLDALLEEVVALGVQVSTRPDVILRLGTKQVLYDTRHLGWGCDTHVYRGLEALRRELPARAATPVRCRVCVTPGAAAPRSACCSHSSLNAVPPISAPMVAPMVASMVASSTRHGRRD
jgi:hypothetical protein